MLTIISAIIGFVGGFIPELLKLWNKKEDNKHELAVLDKQIEANRLLHEQKLEEINTQADIKESIALYEASKIEQTGVKWADVFLAVYNGTVRPTITYGFVGLYMWVKFTMIYTYMWIQELPAIQTAQAVWTEFDNSALMLVLGYYFGQRMAQKVFNVK